MSTELSVIGRDGQTTRVLYFNMTPQDALDALKGTPHKVLTALEWFSGRSRGTRELRVTNRAIAEKCLLSPRTVQLCLAILVEKGFIAIADPVSDRRIALLYTFARSSSQGYSRPANTSGGGRKELRGGGARNYMGGAQEIAPPTNVIGTRAAPAELEFNSREDMREDNVNVNVSPPTPKGGTPETPDPVAAAIPATAEEIATWRDELGSDSPRVRVLARARLVACGELPPGPADDAPPAPPPPPVSHGEGRPRRRPAPPAERGDAGGDPLPMPASPTLAAVLDDLPTPGCRPPRRRKTTELMAALVDLADVEAPRRLAERLAEEWDDSDSRSYYLAQANLVRNGLRGLDEMIDAYEAAGRYTDKARARKTFVKVFRDSGKAR